MESLNRWSRRQFIGLSADVALLTTLAGLLNPELVVARALQPTITIFDSRFPRARRLALALAGADRLVMICGDATALAQEFAVASPPAETVRLQGVTTESVPFCLSQLKPRAELHQRRLDRDLFAWTLEARS